MEQEIEEQINDELEVVMFKFGQKLQRLEDKRITALEESTTTSKSLGVTLEMCFEIKKVMDETIIEIKSIQEKYKDHLKDESNA